MSSETENKQTPEAEAAETAEAEKQAETAAEEAKQPEAEEAKEETEAKETKEVKKGFFNKKNAELEALKAKAETAEKKADELKNRLLRTAAEYENYRKRSAREADTKFNDGVSFAVTQILGIIDTLDMAANAACTDENYKKGVVMTLDKAQQAFKKLNITEIEVLGKPFDPNLMNAVQQVPPQEGQESGQVVTVFQKGYKIGDKIIRHATVVVAE